METNYDEYKPKIKFKKRFIFLILGSILLFAIIAFCVYDILIAKGDKLLLPTGIAKAVMFTSSMVIKNLCHEYQIKTIQHHARNKYGLPFIKSLLQIMKKKISQKILLESGY